MIYIPLVVQDGQQRPSLNVPHIPHLREYLIILSLRKLGFSPHPLVLAARPADLCETQPSMLLLLNR